MQLTLTVGRARISNPDLDLVVNYLTAKLRQRRERTRQEAAKELRKVFGL